MTENDIGLLEEKATIRKTSRDLKIKELKENRSLLLLKEKELDNCRKARILVQKVAEETQKRIEFHIGNLVSTALAAVFPNPYEFVLRFTQRRNRTECDLLFCREGKEYDPISATGGGAVDVASFALRAALWSVKKNRPLFILDEPFKFVSVDLQSKCSLMLKELSKKLKFQIIMISHLPNIIESADKVFRIKNVDGKSVIGEERK
jgi:DNA repair exonuclease SbcCD ATPase subunit